MRRLAVLVSLAFGSLTAACADQSSFEPSQLEQVTGNSLAAGKSSTDGGGGKKVGGSAGGVKGKQR